MVKGSLWSTIDIQSRQKKAATFPCELKEIHLVENGKVPIFDQTENGICCLLIWVNPHNNKHYIIEGIGSGKGNTMRLK